MYTCLHVWAHYAGVRTATCVCVYLLMHAHVATHVKMLCMTSCVTKRRYIIVSCQGDIAREGITHPHGHNCMPSNSLDNISLSADLFGPYQQ